MVTVTSGDVYPVAGSDITLNCTIVLDSAVDTDVMVTAVWNGPKGALNGTLPTDSHSDGTYKSTLTLTSLGSSNSGDYTCTAMANSDDTLVIASDEKISDLTITVGKESNRIQ